MKYDAVIIGGGHNGLVAAAFLAKSGRKVLVLERRATLGGAAGTEEIFPGFQVNTGAQDAGMFLPEIVDALELTKHGLEFLQSPVAVFAPQPDGTALTLWHVHEKTRDEIARFSVSDARHLEKFRNVVCHHTKILKGLLTLTPPDLKHGTFFDLMKWSRVGIKFRRSARRDLMELLRILPMSVKQFLDEYFENEALKAAIGAPGIIGSMQGPQASGTTLMMLYQTLCAEQTLFRPSRFVRGGMGKLSESIANAARGYGAEIRMGSAVSSISVSQYKTTGVVLENGEEIQARSVLSSIDPRQTFLTLVGAPKLGPQFVRKVRNIRYRGCMTAVHLALSELPKFSGMSEGHAQLSGHIQICPSLEYLERAYDDAKYGQISKNPFLDIVIPTVLDSALAPAGKHIMSINCQYTPYHLKRGNWDDMKEQLTDNILDTLTEYAANLPEIILHRHVITPLDLELEYGLTEGCIYHGQMCLDQLLCMRPVAGFGQYRTPVERLYLCGAGAHPGGGVTGAPGFNAAREVLKDSN